MDKFLYADIASVKTKGLKHLKYSEKWPVSEDEFQEFSKYMYQQYEQLMFTLDDNIFDLALIEYKFQTSLLQIFHYNYIKNYACENDIRIFSEYGSQEFLNPDWSKFGKYYSSFRPHHNKLARVVRRIAKNIILNKGFGFLTSVSNFFSKNKFICVGSHSKLKEKFSSANNIYCNHKDIYDILNFSTDKTDLANQYHRKIMNSLVKPYIKILKSNQAKFLNGISAHDMEECWSMRFKEMIPLYINILDSDSKDIFLVTEVANIMHRVLIIGYQRIGCQVFGFHHGGDFSATILRQIHKGAMTHCRDLVVPTKGIADQYKKEYSDLELEIKTGTKYHPVSLSKLLYKAKLALNKPVKVVMLIGFPMSCSRMTDEAALFFYPRVNIEYDLLILLKQMGLYVIYKAHPDRVDEVKGLFDVLVDEVVIDPFEKVYNKADAFIFTYTSTTTFSFSLTTNKKVILIDVDTNPVDSQLRDDLSKRVCCVPARIDKDDIIKFDKNKLKDFLV
jgi:hypothetical protein